MSEDQKKKAPEGAEQITAEMVDAFHWTAWAAAYSQARALDLARITNVTSAAAKQMANKIAGEATNEFMAAKGVKIQNGD